ncbi:MAG: hypothetical protein HGA95_03365 [Caldiserica bacterium]|nr:hypothetical protein [Caldisericota bacterium]
MKRFLVFLVILSLVTVTMPAHARVDIGIFGILEEKTHFKYPMSVFVDTESNNMIVADTGHAGLCQRRQSVDAGEEVQNGSGIQRDGVTCASRCCSAIRYVLTANRWAY